MIPGESGEVRGGARVRRHEKTPGPGVPDPGVSSAFVGGSDGGVVGQGPRAPRLVDLPVELSASL